MSNRIKLPKRKYHILDDSGDRVARFKREAKPSIKTGEKQARKGIFKRLKR